MLFRILALAIVLLNSPKAFSYELNPEIWIDIPSPSHISVYLYPVYSKELKTAHEEMLRSGPEADNGSAHYAAAHWKIEWNWPYLNGMPDYKNFKLFTTSSLILPVPRDKKLKESAKWKYFMQEMIKHELQHLEHARLLRLQASNLISNFPENLDVKEANKKINTLVRDIRLLDLDYDRKTKHGLVEGISLKTE